MDRVVKRAQQSLFPDTAYKVGRSKAAYPAKLGK